MTKDGYYTSGEFAKMANVSLRTIRFYDKKGLLKPSKMGDNGYRLYSDADFAKLQKILSLKYLGFSLDEIMGMTLSDDNQNYIKDSIGLQLNLVQKRIEHLKLVEESLKETSKRIAQNETIDWSEMLPLLHVTTMEKALVEQYKNSSNLNIRIELHQKYSTNPEEWFHWLFRQSNFKEGQKVLELGCGTGELWWQNKEHIPADFNAILSDQSKGMVADAQEKIGMQQGFSYEVFPCEKIPYSIPEFDRILANHVLFYVKNRARVYEKIKKVLKKDGIFICSTYGQDHMKEITEIVKEFDERINLSAEALYDIFGLEHGEEELRKYFSDVTQINYEDYLVVNQAEPLIAYIISCHGNQQEYLSRRYLEFKEFIEKKLRETGSIKITKSAGIFVCKNNS